MGEIDSKVECKMERGEAFTKRSGRSMKQSDATRGLMKTFEILKR